MSKRQYFTWDLECYPNCFTFAGKFTNSEQIYLYEISDRKDQKAELLQFLGYLRNLGIEMVGFNNIGYDYFLLHELMTNPYTFDQKKAFQISQTIIKGQRFNKGYKRIKFYDRIIPQIDIYKVCHFDNKAKTTSLKALQFTMRLPSLEDLPFDIRPLNDQEKDELCTYNVHDVYATEIFFLKNEHLIQIRRDYLEMGTLRGDVLNFNDTKIGTDYLVNRLGRNLCYKGGKARQTVRAEIVFNNIILPKIYFRTEEYQAVHNWFWQQRMSMEKGAKRPKLSTHLAGIDFEFAVGGVHGSAKGKAYHSTDTHQIIDLDVTSMYPSIAITNNFVPEHLGNAFTVAYKQIKADRMRHKKGTPQNAALKLALNSAYGNSNNPFSFMYDPKFTFSVTVNGQLQLLQFVEMLDLIPDCELIQANTDGVTIRIRKDYIYLLDLWKVEWEKMTGLELEEVEYSRMWIRDVNNYISEKMDGKLKSKGTYWYPKSEKDYQGSWHKDLSNVASKKAAEKVMTHSWPLEAAIKLVTDPFDFMLRYKATGSSKIFIGDKQQLKTVRYYVTTDGEPMKKVAPPKGEAGQYKRKNKLENKYFDDIMREIGKDVWDERVHTKSKGKYGTVTTGIQTGWLVKQCNVASDFSWDNVNWDYYIEEAKKIIIGSK